MIVHEMPGVVLVEWNDEIKTIVDTGQVTPLPPHSFAERF
jgi:hypothetical protein